MKSFYRKRENKGYTLAEILLTVAILLVLMAIAVPAIFTIRKNLRQKALDNKAEIIYTAVQNNLTKLKSNGNSESFAAKRATLVDATPTDAEDEKTLYFVTADQKNTAGSAASVVVTEDTVDADLYEHYWVVEYDPASASVYAVFYSETRDDYSPAAYDPLRYKKNRLKDGARVGYYGGDSIDGSNTSALVPKVTVKNDEKLQVIINCKRPDDNPLSFEVKLTDAEDHVINLKYGTDAAGKNLVHLEDDLHLAGLILCAQAGMGNMEAGNMYEMYGVAAGVIGGVSPLGGTGILLGTLAGAAVWQTLENGLNMIGAQVGIQRVVIGVIVVVAVLLDVVVRNGKFGKRK